MSKDRDLIFDMTEDPEVLTYPAVDHELLQLGGVGDDASAAADRQVTTPGDVHVAPQMPAVSWMPAKKFTTDCVSSAFCRWKVPRRDGWQPFPG